MDNNIAVTWQKTNCWKNIKWLNYQIFKNPCDLIIMQEILNECKPSLVIECGTNQGGAAVFFISILRDLLNLEAHLITIDINHSNINFGKYTPHITMLNGSSTDLNIFKKVKSLVRPDDKTMVVLDSDHSYNHVKTELNLYHTLVSPNQYLICEDTIVDEGLGWGTGAHKAAIEFVKEHPEFVVDKNRERLLFTFNPDGYLLNGAQPVS